LPIELRDSLVELFAQRQEPRTLYRIQKTREILLFRLEQIGALALCLHEPIDVLIDFCRVGRPQRVREYLAQAPAGFALVSRDLLALPLVLAVRLLEPLRLIVRQRELASNDLSEAFANLPAECLLAGRCLRRVATRAANTPA
jgi:hypothetical protein